MCKKLLTFLLVPAIFLTFGATSAQAQDTTQTVDKSLSGQYREMIQKSKNNDQGFKIINPSRLSSFNKNYADSLRQTRTQLSEAQKRIAAQNKSITTLKADLSTKEISLSESKSQIDEIKMLGIPFSKSTYNWIMWGLVFLLGAAVAFLIFQSSSLRKETRYRTNLFTELSEEFQAFKTKANDKEKRLARELQTEKNRVDELLKR